MSDLSPRSHSPQYHRNILHSSDDDGDTASQRSISLSSPTTSPRHSTLNEPRDSMLPSLSSNSFSKRASKPYTLDTDYSSEADDISFYNRDSPESPNTSAAPSVIEEAKESPSPVASPRMVTYPPRGVDTESIAESFTSGSSRKARPESMLVVPPVGPLVLGIALVDFNHLVGPKIEWSKGEIFEDEEVAKILPFLALPDGAHLNAEDYSYFHLVPSGPNPTTIFGISCNQQIATSALLVKMPDVTRSTVQKAVVVLASKPVFGPIRDKLGVVTTALFNQRDFQETQILDDFEVALEPSLRGQLTESGLYMGTNLREFVHIFRQRTLILVKALMLQKRILFYGHPVERLCTYQYSLISLLPGLLQTLDDCGSPPLAARAPTLSRPSSLRTSDHKSMMAYMGLPLDIFGKDAFFQPYLPLQQMDMLKETKSWLCGSTNSIVTQQSDIDLLVNTETGAFEFRDPKLERSAGLTPADRKWMDDIIQDVNEGWSDEDPTRSQGAQFKGSDDYLRTKFEDYITAALASVRYRDFVAKGEGNGVIITGGTGGDASSTEDFNPLWISEFKNTNAYEVWERTTDPLLFDIVEPRHPCNEKPSVVADISLRLTEGIQELKLEQQLAPAREAVARTITAGSANFFKAVEGVRGKWMQRSASSSSSTSDDAKNSRTSTPVDITKAELQGSEPSTTRPTSFSRNSSDSKLSSQIQSQRPNFSAWGANIGAFVSTRASRFSLSRTPTEDSTINTSTTATKTKTAGSSTVSPTVPFTASPIILSPQSSPSIASMPSPLRSPELASVVERRTEEQTETTGMAL
ncbi:transport protein Avl9-domain-containing protein [Desarmillaria ectypa]|nr:transport protein Avl9-domain-containing protein [Desarmillaria ectypa]